MGYRPCRRPRNSDRRWPKWDERQIFRPPEFVGGHLYHCVSSWFCSGSPICISVFTTVRRSWLNMTAGRCLVHTTYASIEQDSSARGGHFVPRRAAETPSGKPLKAKQNHGKPWQDSSLKRKSKGSVGHASETGKPQQDSSPNLPKPSPVKLSNVAFWRPKETERWCNHKQRKPQQCNHKQRNPQHCNHKRNKETSAGFKSEGWSIRPLTGCRNSIFKTAKSKPKPWQTLPGFKP